MRRKKLQDELAQLRNQPPPIIDRKSPAPPTIPRSGRSPVPPSPVPVQPRPVRPTTEIFLPQHCPSLIRKTNENPTYIAKYRDEAKKTYVQELEDAEYLGIIEVR